MTSAQEGTQQVRQSLSQCPQSCLLFMTDRLWVSPNSSALRLATPDSAHARPSTAGSAAAHKPPKGWWRWKATLSLNFPSDMLASMECTDDSVRMDVKGGLVVNVRFSPAFENYVETVQAP